MEFNRFNMPAIYYVEGPAPKIIMDITNTKSIRKEWTEMKVQGTMIKRVRATAILRQHPADRLDMDPREITMPTPFCTETTTRTRLR